MKSTYSLRRLPVGGFGSVWRQVFHSLAACCVRRQYASCRNCPTRHFASGLSWPLPRRVAGFGVVVCLAHFGQDRRSESSRRRNPILTGYLTLLAIPVLLVAAWVFPSPATEERLFVLSFRSGRHSPDVLS